MHELLLGLYKAREVVKNKENRFLLIPTHLRSCGLLLKELREKKSRGYYGNGQEVELKETEEALEDAVQTLEAAAKELKIYPRLVPFTFENRNNFKSQFEDCSLLADHHIFLW